MIFRKPKYPYRLGVALSGGGARGFSHIGALSAMNDMGIYPDIVSGVSAGAIAAVLYGSGMSAFQVVSAFKRIKLSDICGLSIPREGFLKFDGFKEFLYDTIPYRRIEELPIKTVIGVTDFDSGEKVMFESGPIDEIVAASCSIPVVFRPVIMNGRRMVDGGVVRNLPAWTIRERCKYLIGVNCSPITHSSSSTGILSTALRTYELMAKNNVWLDAAMCDFVISMKAIAGIKEFDLNNFERMITYGYNRTVRCLTPFGFKQKNGHTRILL